MPHHLGLRPVIGDAREGSQADVEDVQTSDVRATEKLAMTCEELWSSVVLVGTGSRSLYVFSKVERPEITQG